MRKIIEPGFDITLPDDNGFRFQQKNTYQKLQHIKEMDFGWYHEADDVLYLVELKDWKDARLLEDRDPNYTKEQLEALRTRIRNSKIKDLIGKSLGTAAMLSSILLDRSTGKRLLRDLKQDCTVLDKLSTSTKLKFYSIANWQETDTTYIQNLADTYQSRFKSYADLFQVKPYQLITKQQAQRILPFTIR